MDAFRLAVVLVLALPMSQACIYLYGDEHNAMAPPAGTPWNYAYKGANWDGVDAANKSWSCTSGKKQSPINIEWAAAKEGGKIYPALRTKFSYGTLMSNGSNIKIVNTGHTVQVQWPAAEFVSDVTIAAPADAGPDTKVTAVLGMQPTDATQRVKATPLQFHFHTGSEHMLNGHQYPLEMHIVHSVTGLPGCAAGCFAVVGILFKLHNGDDNPLLETLFKYMPMNEGETVSLPAGEMIEVGKLLPTRRDYVSYEGSLTTPPCSEGLLWHVLNEPQYISHAQWAKYQLASSLKDCSDHADHDHHRRSMLADGGSSTCEVVGYGINYRDVQPLNGRTVRYAQ